MNDRELLELAAKATGIELLWREGDDQSPRTTDNKFWIWNPLLCDGDALRLAVNLGIFKGFGVLASIHAGGEMTADIDERGPDDGVNTRRAIVRAAAEIGKAMK